MPSPYPGVGLWPVEWNAATFHGALLDITAEASQATLRLWPNVPVALTHETSTTVILPQPREISVGAGEFTVAIPATDDPRVSPSGWTYTLEVRARINGRLVTHLLSMQAPAGQTVELRDVMALGVAPLGDQAFTDAYLVSLLLSKLVAGPGISLVPLADGSVRIVNTGGGSEPEPVTTSYPGAALYPGADLYPVAV